MRIKDSLLDLIYPKRCPFCGLIRPYMGTEACEPCLEKLKPVRAPFCFKCGKTVESDEISYCFDCIKVQKTFERGFPTFLYEEPIKKSLYDFKYKNQRSYASFFGAAMVARYGDRYRSLGIDGIIPVPVHPNKRRKRGYNQAELLAKELGKRIEVPVFSRYILRTTDTSPQKELDNKLRMKNLRNAFKIGENTIKLKKVLLVDDIYTTGATIEACTQILKSYGIEKVYYTSVAIGSGYGMEE